MPDQAWGLFDDGQGAHVLIAVGWSIVPELWPVVLVGALIGFIVFGTLYEFFYEYVDKEDHETQIQRLELKTKNAKENAENALEIARKEFERERDVLNAHATDLRKQQTEINTLKASYESELDLFKSERERFDSETEVLKKRAVNAICAAERIKRKADGKKRLSAKK